MFSLLVLRQLAQLGLAVRRLLAVVVAVEHGLRHVLAAQQALVVVLARDHVARVRDEEEQLDDAHAGRDRPRKQVRGLPAPRAQRGSGNHLAQDVADRRVRVPHTHHCTASLLREPAKGGRSEAITRTDAAEEKPTIAT